MKRTRPPIPRTRLEFIRQSCGASGEDHPSRQAPSDPVLGEAIDLQYDPPGLAIYENGLMLRGPDGWQILYEEITDHTWLTLPQLMLANKQRDKPIDFTITTATGSYSTSVHLWQCTWLMSKLKRLKTWRPPAWA